DVDERQADAGGDLEHEERERRAPEDVPPARGSPWHRMGGDGRDRAGKPRTGFEPAGDRAQRCGDLRHHTGPARVGSCPPRTQSCPFRTSYSYSKSPRGGGPDAREPRLALGKARHLTELDPCLAGTPADRPEEVSDDRNSRQHGGEGAQ